jgi:hypothetical protein
LVSVKIDDGKKTLALERVIRGIIAFLGFNGHGENTKYKK